MPVMWIILGAGEIIQGVAQHFSGKHGFPPPWAQITVGSIVFLGNLGRLALERWLPGPPVPQPPSLGSRTFPEQIPPPSAAFTFRQPR
jgi:hypothetical protein